MSPGGGTGPEGAGAGSGHSPMLERVVERSMMARLPGLLSTERLASDRSAVTRVMEILQGTGAMMH